MTILCNQKLCHREDYLHKKFGIYCSHVWALVNFPKSSSEFSKKSRLFHVQSYKSKVFQLISLKFWGLVEGVLANNRWKFQVNNYYITRVIVICWKKFIFRKNRKKNHNFAIYKKWTPTRTFLRWQWDARDWTLSPCMLEMLC